MTRILLLILSVTLSISSYAQNYRRYYELVDSALYFTCIGNYMKADSLYEKTFSQFNGFSRHYANAVLNIYKQNPEKGNEYAAKAFQQGCPRAYLEIRIHLLPGFDKKKFREIWRINKKDAKGVHQKEIRRMRIRDFWAHSLFPKRIPRADSINFVKLKEYLKNDSLLLHSLRTGNDYILGSTLFFHVSMNWNRFQELAPYYVHMVENGWADRGFLSDIMDYYNIRIGKLVYMDEYGNVTKGENDKPFDSDLYYSILGEAVTYTDKSTNIMLIPLNPNIPMHEIDVFRKSVFLSPYNMYRQINPKWTLL